MNLIFVTGNKGKLVEAQSKLKAVGWGVTQHEHEYPEIQTDALSEVAQFGLRWLRAHDAVLQESREPFMLEDAGLFVDALKGFPGVYSAYIFKTIGYDGILQLMTDIAPANRGAYFEACIGYYEPKNDGSQEHVKFFSGRCYGHIAEYARGSHGFGFDPIFIPEGRQQTFAELTIDEKNTLSHRARALQALEEYLRVRR